MTEKRTDGSGDGRRVHPLSIWVPVALMILGGLVGVRIMNKQQDQRVAAAESGRPPILDKVKNIELVERSGEQVKLESLLHKVIVLSYVYTECPRGCLGVIEEVKELRQEFEGDSDKIQFVSISVDPEHDRPDVLQEFAERAGADFPNWWFLTGDDREVIWRYMKDNFRLTAREIEERERISPTDKFEHDFNLVVVDGRGHWRGLYNLMHPDKDTAAVYAGRIRANLRYLIDGGE